MRKILRLLTFALSAYAGYRFAEWRRSRLRDYDPCDNRDGALTDESFVFVSSPRPGERVGSHFTVDGGASTPEGHLTWRLVDRAGTEIAAGKETTGRGPEPEPFAFPVSYVVAARQIGQLEVAEPERDGDASIPLVNTIPLVLHPGPAPRR